MAGALTKTIGAILVTAAAVAGIGLALGLWSSDDRKSVRERVSARVAAMGGSDGVIDRGLAGDGCEKLAATADAIAAEAKDARALIRQLGREAAGIHTGARALIDLASGGRNVIKGSGFRTVYDDGSEGQSRHFSGIAVAASYGGEQATRLISIFGRRDPLDSPDGRLTEAGIEFTKGLVRGKIALADAGDWILERLCAPA